MPIGSYPRISLKAAHDIHDEQKRLLYEDETNLYNHKKCSKDHRWGKHAQPTFEAVARDWHATKTAGTWTGHHSIDAITAQYCLAVLHSIEQRASNETVKRFLGVISQVLDYAVAIGHCAGGPDRALAGG